MLVIPPGALLHFSRNVLEAAIHSAVLEIWSQYILDGSYFWYASEEIQPTDHVASFYPPSVAFQVGTEMLKYSSRHCM